MQPFVILTWLFARCFRLRHDAKRLQRASHTFTKFAQVVLILFDDPGA